MEERVYIYNIVGKNILCGGGGGCAYNRPYFSE